MRESTLNKGINDGLYGYSYINPNWNSEQLVQWSKGYQLGKIILAVKSNKVNNVTCENAPHCIYIRVWINGESQALTYCASDKKDVEYFKEITGITSIKKQ